MNYVIASIRTLGVATIAALAITTIAAAQPHGWGCDYGFRPGNTWFYPSPYIEGKIDAYEVLRDSTGADGAYWVYVVPAIGPSWWYRIDSACTFSKYKNPSDPRPKLWFKPGGKMYDKWTVDSSLAQSIQIARIDWVMDREIFGQMALTTSISYFHIDQDNDTWDRTEEWAEKFGVVSRWGEPTGSQKLIGAIIDGVTYGVTSGVDEPASADARAVAIYPLPASDHATLAITAHGERRAAIEIHDMLGRLVRREAGETLRDGLNVVPLEVGGLAPGSYLVVVSLDGKRYTSAMVVAR